MSTTRKIEGWTDPEFLMNPGNMSASITVRANALPGDALITAIIGGKGYTQEEVRALLRAVLWNPKGSISDILAKHGIESL